MTPTPVSTDADLRTEIDALRAQVDDLNRQVAGLRAEIAAQDAPGAALERSFGARSLLGLRWLGTSVYYLLFPIHLVVRLGRFIVAPVRRYSAWETLYAASFTWVYLAGKEPRLLPRLRRFLPAFKYVRSHLRQNQ